MVFNEALTEYLITGLEEALAASGPHPLPEPLSVEQHWTSAVNRASVSVAGDAVCSVAGRAREICSGP
jgi:hypothetical protein